MNSREVALNIINRVLIEGAYSNLVLSNELNEQENLRKQLTPSNDVSFILFSIIHLSMFTIQNELTSPTITLSLSIWYKELGEHQ